MTRLNLKNIVVKLFIHWIQCIYMLMEYSVLRTIHTELYFMVKIGVNMLQTEIRAHIVVPLLFQKSKKSLKKIKIVRHYILYIVGFNIFPILFLQCKHF